jgi:hypothetical protein
MRQLMVHNKCRTNHVKTKFGAPGGGLTIPTLLKIFVGVVLNPELQDLRLSFGTYGVKHIDNDKSLVLFRSVPPTHKQNATHWQHIGNTLATHWQLIGNTLATRRPSRQAQQAPPVALTQQVPQKRPALEAKETCYRGKRDLL